MATKYKNILLYEIFSVSLPRNFERIMKLSIIIPVYNVAPYLRKCVESVLEQDLNPEEYEVILVDDGSTDGSGEICDSLTPSPSPEERGKGRGKGWNIRVIHKKNAGLSAARNAGIAVATGEYIQFVDSDDYLEPNVLGGLVRQMDAEQLDVLRFDYQNVRLTDGVYFVFEPYKTPRKVDQCTEIVDGETYLNTRMQTACYAVQFMIRRSLLTPSISPRREEGDDMCLFTPGIYFEDVEWMPRMVLRALRMNATTTIVYNYLMREGSITKTKDMAHQRKNVEDKFVIIDTLNQLLEQHPRCMWLLAMRSTLVQGVLSSVAECLFAERRTIIAKLKQNKVFPLYISNQGKTYKRRAMLINLSPLLFCSMIHYMHS